MKWLLLLTAFAAIVSLSGCIHLGAKPNDFDCADSDLAPYWHAYDRSPLIAEIQRDAGADFGEHSLTGAGGRGEEKITDDPIYNALVPKVMPKAMPDTVRVLLLSGGGQWGAFGAGFLNKLKKKDKLEHFDVVTGVSTGAIQGLFVSAGDFEGLEAEYRKDSLLATKGGLFTAVFKGYLNDTKPLRLRLEQALCGLDGQCAMVRRLALSRSHLFIGFVEARSGNFRVIDVTRLAADAVTAQGRDKDALRKAAQCIVGVTMASAAVPVQMRPVRLRDNLAGGWRTHTDGGVRLSVFEANLALVLNEAQKSLPVEVYAIRNGPTVVKPRIAEPGEVMPKIDRKPSVDEVAMMSYSTLVNQNEVMSLAALRLLDPDGKIFVATADGFNTPFKWRKSAPMARPDDKQGIFNVPFMNALADWGRDKAVNHPQGPWIELKPLCRSQGSPGKDHDAQHCL